MSEERLYPRGVKVEIAKPLEMAWSELEDILKAHHSYAYRLYNAAVLDVLHNVSNGAKPNTYQAVLVEIQKTKEYFGKERDKLTKRLAAAKRKGTAIDALQRELRDRTRKADIDIGSRVVNAYAQNGNKKAMEWFRGGRRTRFPSAKAGFPITIRDGGWALEREGDGFRLKLKLASGRVWVSVAVRGSHGSHYATLSSIASGAFPATDCKITYESNARRKSGHSGKWMVILGHKAPAAQHPGLDPARSLVVHRGCHNFLTLLSSDGHSYHLRGEKFLTTRARLKARMRGASKISGQERGACAKKRGRARRKENQELKRELLKA